MNSYLDSELIDQWRLDYCTNSSLGCKFYLGKEKQFTIYGFLPCLKHHSPVLKSLTFETEEELKELKEDGLWIMRDEEIIYEEELLLIWNALHGCYETKHLQDAFPYLELSYFELYELCSKRKLDINDKLAFNTSYLISLLRTADDPNNENQMDQIIKNQKERLFKYMNWFQVSKESNLWIDFVSLFLISSEHVDGIIIPAIKIQAQNTENHLRHYLFNQYKESMENKLIAPSILAYETFSELENSMKAILHITLEAFPITFKMRFLDSGDDYSCTSFHFILPGYIRDWINTNITLYECEVQSKDSQKIVIHSFMVLNNPYRQTLKAVFETNSESYEEELQELYLNNINFLLLDHVGFHSLCDDMHLFTTSTELMDLKTRIAFDKLLNIDKTNPNNINPNVIFFSCILYASSFFKSRESRSMQIVFTKQKELEENIEEKEEIKDQQEQKEEIKEEKQIKIFQSLSEIQEKQLIFKDEDSNICFISMFRRSQYFKYLLNEDWTQFIGKMDEWGVIHSIDPVKDKHMELPHSLQYQEYKKYIQPIFSHSLTSSLLSTVSSFAAAATHSCSSSSSSSSV